MAENDGSATEKLTFLLIGAGIGATLALLFAPKSGRELRGDIADYTKKGLDAANEGARAIGERAVEVYGTTSGRVAEAYGTASGKVADAYGTASEKVADVYGTAREKVSQGAGVVSEVAGRQKDQIAAAIEAGKQAYREEKRKVGELGRAAVEGEES
ncbi:MAG TPA: YtxH domain-containing protein [Blastocatellia bacterium]|jgi:gas vesicle protein|nr:YtxH domain-containing protein [Blastocatellia bacterium]